MTGASVRCAYLGLSVATLLTACKTSAKESGEPVATTSASAAAASASAAAAPGSPPPALVGSYTGSFQAKVGSVSEVPAEAKVTVWAKDPGTEALGAGTLTLVIAAGKRVLQGEGKGALGDLVVSGDLDGPELRARVDPKDPNGEPAMTGVLAGTFAAGAFTGTLRVASKNANVVRTADITLRK